MVRLAKELDFDENKSFLAKVEAVTEGRCNSKFMDTLLRYLKFDAFYELKTQFLHRYRNLQTGENQFGASELLTRLINILAPRIELQNGFSLLSTDNPDFVREVLDCLKGDPREVQGFNAIDLLHHAITKVINNKCQRKIDDVVHKVELDGLVFEKDQDIRSMLEQAIGLAKYMGKSGVVDSLFELLGDPIRLEAIRDDPVIKDVLNKILVMQNLTEKAPQKRHKLEKLQRYHQDSHDIHANGHDEDDDNSLAELIKICDALIRPPHQGNLRKSKSMVKKSKSMIMTAKDIPMNAFMAMKNDEKKDEKWLQNFLSKSIVEEIPWECSKALIILKEGYQAIIPREASRSILLGEASYTLIDDTGVEFYLSPKDKVNRKKQGLEDGSGVKKVKLCDDEPDSASESEVQKVPLQDAILLSDNATAYGQDKPDFEPLNFASPDDYKPYRSQRRRPNYDFSDDEEEDEGTMKSLQKYRPSFYEVGPPKESGDINDIRDYYTNMLTRTRAINRFGTSYQPQGLQDQDDYELHGQPAPHGYGEPSMQPRGYGGEYDPYAEQRMPARPSYRQQFDESTKYLLDKAKAARTRQLWEPEDLDYETEERLPHKPQEVSRGPQGRAADETMMSSRTRSLLDQVKQSTAALQTMSSLDDEEEMNGRGARKPSRFLRRQEPETRRAPNDAFDVSRMADEILGENVFPARDPPNRYSSTNAARRKHSYQSSLDTSDRFSDRSSPELRVQPNGRSVRGRDDDDDDLDAMINSLKQKTSGRDMSKVIYDIEGESNGRTYGRKSVSPIPQRDYSFDPMPDPRPRQSTQRAGPPQSSFDPYSHLRGGSGYDTSDTMVQRSYRQQPSSQFAYQRPPPQPQMDPYGYAPPPSMGFGYGPPQRPPMHQPMYQPAGYYPNPAAAPGRRPSYGYYD